MSKAEKKEHVENDHYKSIHNWGDIQEVYDLALDKAKENDLIIEVGVWLGHSVCYVGETSKRLGKKIRIAAVDIFGGENVQKDMVEQGVTDHDDALEKFKNNIIAQGITDIVEIVVGDSVLKADAFLDESARCVYLDADHSYEAVIADMVAYWPKVRSGGLLSGHDYLNTDTGVRRAVEWFAARFGLEVKVTSEQWPSWYIVKP